MASILSPRFENDFQVVVHPDNYFKAIEIFVNQEQEVHLKFLFKLFDVFNEDKITEAGLFKFMEDASLRRADISAVQTEILGINE